MRPMTKATCRHHLRKVWGLRLWPEETERSPPAYQLDQSLTSLRARIPESRSLCERAVESLEFGTGVVLHHSCLHAGAGSRSPRRSTCSVSRCKPRILKHFYSSLIACHATPHLIGKASRDCLNVFHQLACATYGRTIFVGSTIRSNSASVTKPSSKAAALSVRSLSMA